MVAPSKVEMFSNTLEYEGDPDVVEKATRRVPRKKHNPAYDNLPDLPSEEELIAALPF